MDHLQRGSLKLDCIKHVVLDEADEMLDMGFAKVPHTKIQLATKTQIHTTHTIVLWRFVDFISTRSITSFFKLFVACHDSLLLFFILLFFMCVLAVLIFAFTGHRGDIGLCGDGQRASFAVQRHHPHVDQPDGAAILEGPDPIGRRF